MADVTVERKGERGDGASPPTSTTDVEDDEYGVYQSISNVDEGVECDE